MNKDYSTAAMLKEYLPPLEHNLLTISLSLGMNDRQEKVMTSCDRTHTHKHTDALAEMDAWVKWLESQGVTNITLVGHSRGGNQTAWYASLHNDDASIKNIVLFAPAIGTMSEEEKEYKEKYGKNLTQELAKANQLVKSGKGETVMPHTDLVYCKDVPVTAASFADYYQNNPNMNTLNVLPKIQKPVLVFAGSEDTTVKNLPEKVEPILEKHSNIELFVVDGADHFFLDMAGEDAVNHMNEFMQKP